MTTCHYTRIQRGKACLPLVGEPSSQCYRAKQITISPQNPEIGGLPRYPNSAETQVDANGPIRNSGAQRTPNCRHKTTQSKGLKYPVFYEISPLINFSFPDFSPNFNFFNIAQTLDILIMQLRLTTLMRAADLSTIPWAIFHMNPKGNWTQKKTTLHSPHHQKWYQKDLQHLRHHCNDTPPLHLATSQQSSPLSPAAL